MTDRDGICCMLSVTESANYLRRKGNFLGIVITPDLLLDLASDEDGPKMIRDLNLGLRFAIPELDGWAARRIG